ncbi:MAG TPA: hypothetical protein VMX17_04300 [Candidatus Glassbacteria bacterium]|nr:hypothetical protein [Candidatus Glassbacteria bacterium]
MKEFKWKPIKEQTLESVPGGEYIMVCIENTDSHVDFVVKNHSVWKYCYCGREVQNMKKYTHYFIPRPFKK